MISDSQLNTIALTFGFTSILLIVVYHAISTNIHKLEENAKNEDELKEKEAIADELVDEN
ncbi:OST4 Dolichyl-diphosphooligosaccharide--protein glycosyltransferase 4 kDa subunit [Candida maltosa Xu316]|uniref:Dolichyl-diphosphooligosaccharide--protein glycosyltransferase subunit n=1 Tax=Candida maltosa (strain Xu316) TaxID=1245528 RepID=M3HPF5_CANMX|nr:hypothetical protein G210_5877 [Candida maltosa Xu316]